MTTRPTLRLAAISTFLALVAAAAVSAPALACSGEVLLGVDQHHDEAADLIFTGTAVRVDDPANGLTFSTADPMRWTFVVDRVETGSVGARFAVTSARAEGSCGYVFKLGSRYRVLAQLGAGGGPPSVWLNDGTTPMPPLADMPPVEGEFHTFGYTAVQVLGPVLLLWRWSPFS